MSVVDITTLDLSDKQHYVVDTSEPAPNEAKRLFDYVAAQMKERGQTLLNFPQYDRLILNMLEARLLFMQGNWNDSRIQNFGRNPVDKSRYDIIVFTPWGALNVQVGYLSSFLI